MYLLEDCSNQSRFFGSVFYSNQTVAFYRHHGHGFHNMTLSGLNMTTSHSDLNATTESTPSTTRKMTIRDEAMGYYDTGGLRVRSYPRSRGATFGMEGIGELDITGSNFDLSEFSFARMCAEIQSR